MLFISPIFTNTLKAEKTASRDLIIKRKILSTGIDYNLLFGKSVSKGRNTQNKKGIGEMSTHNAHIMYPNFH